MFPIFEESVLPCLFACALRFFLWVYLRTGVEETVVGEFANDKYVTAPRSRCRLSCSRAPLHVGYEYITNYM